MPSCVIIRKSLMNAMPKKFAVAGVVVLAAIAYLALAGAKKGWTYYLTPDQFRADLRYHNERVKLCGTVAPDGFTVHRGLLTANFLVAGKNCSVPVVYHGAIPDMFRQGAEVVVEGKLNEGGVFVADNLLTKCASKYNAEQAPSMGSGQASPPNVVPLPMGHPSLQRPS